jgi:predicted benzoate:H+ symporter BenE
LARLSSCVGSPAPPAAKICTPDAPEDANQQYSARFACSFGAALFAVTRNQIVAGLISQVFRRLAPVEAKKPVSRRHV